MRVIIIGCTPLAKKVINLVENIATIVGVVNLHPSLGVMKSNYDTLSDFNSRRPKDFLMTKDINDDDTWKWIKKRKCDIIIQCGWSQIFNKRIINTPKLFCIGFHPSPLPIGRGAAVLNWKMIKNDCFKSIDWGNSMFVMDEKTDTGDILDFESIIIQERDDIKTCFFKVDRSSIKMLKRTLPKIESKSFKRTKQKKSKATRFYKRKPSDGLFYFNWNAGKILNYIRALTSPYPGAFFIWESFDNHSIIVWKASLGKVNSTHFDIPGMILRIEDGKGIQVLVGDNETIWIEFISDQNGLECWADEWARDEFFSVGDII